MAKKILIRDGLEYKHKATGQIFKLNEDYNGLWYLNQRSEKGYKKSLSCSKNEMLSTLEQYYVRT